MACSLLNRALVHAVTIDDLDAARTLLEQGADVNARTPEGLTLHAWAAAAGHTAMARLLIQNGAGLGPKDRRGKPAG
jgi:ankyrin repeat protein